MNKNKDDLKKLTKRKNFLEKTYNNRLFFSLFFSSFWLSVLCTVLGFSLSQPIVASLFLAAMFGSVAGLTYYGGDKYEIKTSNELKDLEKRISELTAQKELDKQLEVNKLEERTTEIEQSVSQIASRSIIQKHLKRNHEVRKPVYGRIDDETITL